MRGSHIAGISSRACRWRCLPHRLHAGFISLHGVRGGFPAAKRVAHCLLPRRKTRRLSGFCGLCVENGSQIREEPRSGLIFGSIYAMLACVLMIYGFRSSSNGCAARSTGSRFACFASRWPQAMPALLGLLTGLSLCPPFIAALAGATGQSSLFSSLLLFASFFTATSLYIIPFSFAGLLGRSQAVRITARLAAGIVGCYYLYSGLVLIHGGLSP
jgi:hypothetical protein